MVGKNIIHEIILENVSLEDACAKEIELIAKYKSNISKYGYNKTSGGDVSFCHSRRQKKK